MSQALGFQALVKCWVVVLSALLPWQLCLASNDGADVSEAPFVIAYSADPAESITMRWYDMVVREAFRRLDREFVARVYPPVRSGMLLEQGQVDAEAIRPEGYSKVYPQAVWVNQTLLEVAFSVAVTDPDLKITKWEDFRRKDYRVEFVRGVEPLEQILSEYIDEDSLSEVSEVEQGIAKLIAGRTDVLVDFRGRMLLDADDLRLRGKGIYISDIEEQVPHYTYLNIQYTDLADALAEVFAQMKAEGLFDLYMKEVRQAFSETGR